MKISRTQRLAAGAIFLVVLVAIAVYRPGSPDGPGVDPSASVSPSASAATPSPSGETAGPSASTSVSPSAATTPVPTITPAPTITGTDVSGRWTGTWALTTPFPSSGKLTLVVSQSGSELSASLEMTANACFVSGEFQGAVDGKAVELHNTQRDEVEFAGSISGNSMSGDLSMACDNAMGTFSVTRSN